MEELDKPHTPIECPTQGCDLCVRSNRERKANRLRCQAAEISQVPLQPYLLNENDRRFLKTIGVDAYRILERDIC